MENSMKIGNSPEAKSALPVATERSGTAEAGRSQGGAALAAAASKTPEASARIELSSTASKLMSESSEEGTFDTEKVQRIAQAISEGKFSINAEAIADKLISNAQEMLSRASPH
jgi:negative regulator of flagellin synthesis FlgM